MALDTRFDDITDKRCSQVALYASAAEKEVLTGG
jgi:hypothetical protein